MSAQIPKIDSRSAEDIVTALKSRAPLNDYANDPLGNALMHIFARYCEVIIERLNQAPEKNYRAFLNELGVSRNPGIAAQVPLTFTPAKGIAGTAVIVPQHTKVTAPAGEGETAPVVFETIRPLTLTTAELSKIITLDTDQDCYADLGLLTTPEQQTPGVFPFAGALPIRHEFYLRVDEAIAVNAVSSLQLVIVAGQQASGSPNRHLQWRIESDKDNAVVLPAKDTTMGLSRSGALLFENLPKWEISTRGGVKGYWLSCRLLPPDISLTDNARKMMMLDLPVLSKIDITSRTDSEDTKIDGILFNGITVDISKDFYPLGETPRFGDVLYVNSSAFVNSASTITITIKLTNPASAKQEPPIRRVNQHGNAVIQWEFWNGASWCVLPCSDDTRALTENGQVVFTVPASSQATQVNGIPGGWLRARLISGHYGLPERIQFGHQEGRDGINYIASTLAPPVIASIAVASSKAIGPKAPEAIVSHNDFVFETFDQSKSVFKPFQIGRKPGKAIYFGFKSACREAMSGRWLDLYFRVGSGTDKIVFRGDQQFPVVDWQYWDGDDWKACKTTDETQAFNVSGAVSLWLPEQVLSCLNNTSLAEDTTLYWLRAVWTAGAYDCRPLLQHVLLNTVSATQTMTLENEILGSGNATANQVFYPSRAPILGELALEVREPQPLSATERGLISGNQDEQPGIAASEGNDLQESWVSWYEVGDFLQSGHNDRHFTVERMTGEIRFGDGLKGMLLPAGANNIRLKTYKSGGGISGNKPVNSISQLRTSLPSIASVTNLEASYGGRNSENWDFVYRRGSQNLRHGGLAVTARDFEDIARNASHEVARTKCYPLYDPEFTSAGLAIPGTVSLAIVPRRFEPRPRPDLQLLRSVWKYLDRFRAPGTTLIVLGTEYVSVHVTAVIAPVNDYRETDIAAECRIKLNAFLHPLAGGEQAEGWDFGSIPHQSDLVALLDAVPGLEFVRSLSLAYEEERPGLMKSGIFLVCSGTHKITVA